MVAPRIDNNRGMSPEAKERMAQAERAEFMQLDWAQQNPEVANLLATRSLQPEYDRNGVSNLRQSLDILNILNRHTGVNSTYPDEVAFEMPPAMIPGVLMSEMAFLKETSNQDQSGNGNNVSTMPELDVPFIYEYADLVSVGSQVNVTDLVAALSYSVSAKGFEQCGLKWQEEVLSKCVGRVIDPNTNVYTAIKKAVKKQHSMNINQTIESLTKSIQNPDGLIPEELLNFNAPLVNFEESINEVSNFDIEGLLIKAARAVYNMQKEHRDDSLKAENWSNAQELMSYYGPMLELAGFKKMAELAYGTANRYFYQNSEYLDVAKQTHDNADVVLKELRRHRGLETAFAGPESEFELEGFRVKSTGSITEKMARKPGTIIPDTIGIMLTSKISFEPDEKNDSAIKIGDTINNLLLILENRFSFSIGNPNEGAPEIEIRGYNLTPEQVQIIADNTNCYVTAEPSSVDGYEGIHISAQVDGSTVEVQLHDPRTKKLRKGIASHVFYNIAKNGSGVVQNLRSLAIQARNALVSATDERQIPRLRSNFESALSNFNTKKLDLLNIINDKIHKRVVQLGYVNDFSQINTDTLMSYLNQDELPEDVWNLINTVIYEQHQRNSQFNSLGMQPHSKEYSDLYGNGDEEP